MLQALREAAAFNHFSSSANSWGLSNFLHSTDTKLLKMFYICIKNEKPKSEVFVFGLSPAVGVHAVRHERSFRDREKNGLLG